MSIAEAKVLSYLVPRSDSFWRWSDGGQTVTWNGAAILWPDGRTIAFREEIAKVLSRLAPRGLPPFPSVLLLLAACRTDWKESAERDDLELFTKSLTENVTSPAEQLIATRLEKHIRDVLKHLDNVADLPADLRQTTDAKAILAETVFEGAETAIDPDGAAAVVRALEEGIDPESSIDVAPADARRTQFALELDVLARGLPRVDAKRLALRAKTGLDQEIEEPDLDLTPSERVRTLLSKLRNDQELAGLARLAQNLMAAVHVPRHLSTPEDLPLGGVSDLSNRGPFDRLLVSELAHDDLTLSVRIALNEALYLRREAPARDPRHRRVILLDTGVRMWGIPRLFATAVGLAMAGAADRHAEVVAYRADRTKIEPVELTTRPGLLVHLESLTPEPHPGQAIPALADALKDDESPADVILITHADTLEDRAFTQHLADLPEHHWHVATVDRDGAFVLYALSARGRKIVCQAELSLEDILTPDDKPKPVLPLVKEGHDPNLPIILSVEPFPVRLPAEVEPKTTRVSQKHGMIGVTAGGRFLRWTSDRTGAIQLYDRVPKGRVLEVIIDDDADTAYALVHHRRANQVTIVAADLETNHVTQRQINCSNPIKAYVHGGHVLMIYNTEVHALSLATGRRVGMARTPEGMVWNNGRFFRKNASECHAAAFDGRSISFTHLANFPFVAAFDCGGVGPMLLTNTGYVLVGGSDLIKHRSPFLRNIEWIGANADGTRVAVRAGDNPSDYRSYFADLGDKRELLEWKPAGAEPHAALLGDALKWSTETHVFTHTDFDAILVTDKGDLALSRKNRQHAILLNGSGELILADRGSPQPPHRLLRQLQPTTPPEGCRYKLRRAAWGDGSAAFLDSRGLLHLKSSDKRLPELTLTLSNKPMAGWTSENQTFGWRFFLDGEATTTERYVYEVIRHFIARLR